MISESQIIEADSYFFYFFNLKCLCVALYEDKNLGYFFLSLYSVYADNFLFACSVYGG